LTSALAGGEWSGSRPGRFALGKEPPGTHYLEGWVDPRAGLDDMEKRKFLTSLRFQLRKLGDPYVASRYTEYGILAKLVIQYTFTQILNN
jgi:hypothetical protein